MINVTAIMLIYRKLFNKNSLYHVSERKLTLIFNEALALLLNIYHNNFLLTSLPLSTHNNRIYYDYNAILKKTYIR